MKGPLSSAAGVLCTAWMGLLTFSPVTAQQVTVPTWMSYDRAANAVTIEVVGGESLDEIQEFLGHSFNGYFSGQGEIIVPLGATVTINFSNQDESRAHSLGVDARLRGFPIDMSGSAPVFSGALTRNSSSEATPPGGSETITFTAERAGTYSLACYVPGYAAAGMYVHFTVSQDGTVGVRA